MIQITIGKQQLVIGLIAIMILIIIEVATAENGGIEPEGKFNAMWTFYGAVISVVTSLTTVIMVLWKWGNKQNERIERMHADHLNDVKVLTKEHSEKLEDINKESVSFIGKCTDVLKDILTEMKITRTSK